MYILHNKKTVERELKLVLELKFIVILESYKSFPNQTLKSFFALSTFCARISKFLEAR